MLGQRCLADPQMRRQVSCALTAPDMRQQARFAVHKTCPPILSAGAVLDVAREPDLWVGHPDRFNEVSMLHVGSLEDTRSFVKTNG